MSELQNLRTLVVDPIDHSKNLLKTILASLGVERIHTVMDTGQALAAMQIELFDIVFCDELARPLEPFAFLKVFRKDLKTRDVTVPIVLISSGAELSR